jgi:hypothetical protein
MGEDISVSESVSIMSSSQLSTGRIQGVEGESSLRCMWSSIELSSTSVEVRWRYLPAEAKDMYCGWVEGSHKSRLHLKSLVRKELQQEYSENILLGARHAEKPGRHE